MNNRELKGVVYYGEWDKPVVRKSELVAVALLAAVSFVVGGWPL